MTPQAWKRQAAEFAGQLMLPEMRQLFDYWMTLWRNDDDWPARNAIRPADIRKLLPHVLIVEPRPAPEGMRVRLAGSALWDIYGGEITGTTLTHGLWSMRAAYWRRIYEQMQEQPMPDCGQLWDDVRLSALFWLRLPLRAENGSVWLLGMDIAIPGSRLERADATEATANQAPAGKAPVAGNAGIRIMGDSISSALRRGQAAGLPPGS